jgi:hypothetical protein
VRNVDGLSCVYTNGDGFYVFCTHRVLTWLNICIAFGTNVKLADWTKRLEMDPNLPTVDVWAMEVELARLRALRAKAIDVQWGVPNIAL